MAGTGPDTYHTAIPLLELVTNEVALEMPDEDQAYVSEKYIGAAVERHDLPRQDLGLSDRTPGGQR